VSTAPLALHLNTGTYAVTGAHTTLRGTATRGAAVEINGHVVPNRRGRWGRQLRLHLGSNHILVTASMRGQAPVAKAITVTRHRTSAEIEARVRARREAQARALNLREAKARSTAKRAAEANTREAEGASGCTNGTYTNSAGNTVCKPEEAPTAPAGATAKCEDGTYSFSESRSGTCSHHGGVAEWLAG
jgi:Tfp pilus assembly protein FimV